MAEHPIVERAKEIAATVANTKVKATTDIRKVATLAPCVLVVPAPEMTPTTLDGATVEVEWQIVCVTGQPADLRATTRLIDMATRVWESLEEAVTFTPDAYQVTNEVSLPCLIGSFSEVLAYERGD